MGWENKVVWAEGLFLQPQHLQQQDRYVERLVRTSTAGLATLHLGADPARDRHRLLDARQVRGARRRRHPARTARRSAFPATSITADAARSAGDRAQQRSSTWCCRSASPARSKPRRADRWKPPRASPSPNMRRPTPTPATRQSPRCRSASCGCATRWKARHGHGHPALGLARVVEVRPDRSSCWTMAYIPPLLSCARPRRARRASSRSLQGCCTIRAEALAGRRLRIGTTRGAAEIADYLLLQVCNRYEPLLTHLAATLGQIHPESLYRVAHQPCRRTRDLHRKPQAAAGLPALPARRPERDLPPGDRGAAAGVVRGARTNRRADPVAGAASTASASARSPTAAW